MVNCYIPFKQIDILDLNRLYKCNSDPCMEDPKCFNDETIVQFDRVEVDRSDGHIKLAVNCTFTAENNNQTPERNTLDECIHLCITNKDCTHFTWRINSTCNIIKSIANMPLTRPAQGSVCAWLVHRNELTRNNNENEVNNSG